MIQNNKKTQNNVEPLTAEHIVPPPSHIQPKKSFLSLGIIACVFIPTLIAAFYFLFLASDIYVSETRFAVQVDQSGVPALADGFAQIMSQAPASNDSYIVKSFIESPALIKTLLDKHSLMQTLTDTRASFYIKVPKDASREAIASRSSHLIKLKYDTTSDIIFLTARGFTPQQAQDLTEAILVETENFVNDSSKRMQEDSLKFAEEKSVESEQALLNMNKEIMNFRNSNENFDPTTEASGVIGIMQTLEVELAKAQAERKAALEFYNQSSPKIQSMNAQVRALQNQINDMNSQVATKEGAPLSQLLEDYETLKAKQDFALQRYQTTLVSLETAQLEAQKKQKYLIRIVEPTLPETAAEPQRFYGIITVFFILLIGYGIGRLILDALRDSMI
jgi:capsular polysaccharide transport system permease protein